MGHKGKKTLAHYARKGEKKGQSIRPDYKKGKTIIRTRKGTEAASPREKGEGGGVDLHGNQKGFGEHSKRGSAKGKDKEARITWDSPTTMKGKQGSTRERRGGISLGNSQGNKGGSGFYELKNRKKYQNYNNLHAKKGKGSSFTTVGTHMVERYVTEAISESVKAQSGVVRQTPIVEKKREGHLGFDEGKRRTNRQHGTYKRSTVNPKLSQKRKFLTRRSSQREKTYGTSLAMRVKKKKDNIDFSLRKYFGDRFAVKIPGRVCNLFNSPKRDTKKELRRKSLASDVGERRKKEGGGLLDVL